MRILIVKLSSMGDVIHTLPALTDALTAIPSLQIDWLVDKTFAEIPAWHYGVKKVLVSSHRKWKKQWNHSSTWQEIRRMINELRSQKYDLIIDAQSSIKSALFTKCANGKRVGLDFHSARESIAAILYDQRCRIAKELHAITRIRNLFAAALNYSLPDTSPNYGLNLSAFHPIASPEYFNTISKPKLMFIPNASWSTKLASLAFWQNCIQLAEEAGYHVLLPWGSSEEKNRVEEIAVGYSEATVLPKSSLTELAALLSKCHGILAVDTGLAHLAAALNIPTVTLYGPTSPHLIGTIGRNQVHIQPSFPCLECKKKVCIYTDKKDQKEAQCMKVLDADIVIQSLFKLIN